MSHQDGFDDLLTTIGFGRWQIPSLLVTVLAMSQFSVQLLGSPLLSAPLPFRCFTGPPYLDYYSNSNSSMETEDSAYYNSKCLSPSNMTAFVPQEMNITYLRTTQQFTNILSCPIVEYDTSTFTSTIISQWDLVCERAGLRPIFQTLFTLGGILGSLSGGYVGDRWGRGRAVQIGCIVNILVVIGMFLVPLYTIVMVLRLVAGCTVMGMLVPAWSLVLESTPAKLRSRVGMLLGLPFSASTIGMAALGYYIRTWKYLLLACTSPILILLPLSFIADESPRWLVQKGHVEEATIILQRAVRMNNVQLTRPLSVTVEKLVQTTDVKDDVIAEEDIYFLTPILVALRQVWSYLRAPAMRIILLVTPVIWFLQSCLYLGVVINANNFTSTDPFLYLALSGVMEGSAILIITPLTTRIGRRIMVWAGLALGGLLLLLELMVPTNYYWAKWVLVMVAFLLVAGSYQVNYMYAPELFPTEARARGFAFVTVMGSIGFSCAPLITDVLSQYNWWAVGATFGSSGILGGLLVPLLPETRNTPLPETLQDVEDRHKAHMLKKKIKKKEKKKERNGTREDRYYIDDEELGTELSENSTIRENPTIISNDSSDIPTICAGVTL